MRSHAIRDFGIEMSSLRSDWDWRTALKGAGVVALVGYATFLLFPDHYRLSLTRFSSLTIPELPLWRHKCAFRMPKNA